MPRIYDDDQPPKMPRDRFYEQSATYYPRRAVYALQVHEMTDFDDGAYGLRLYAGDWLICNLENGAHTWETMTNSEFRDAYKGKNDQ